MSDAGTMEANGQELITGGKKMSDYFGKEVPKLGFGLMRLPKKGLRTDVKQVEHMVDLF